jgi:hypothetical protein
MKLLTFLLLSVCLSARAATLSFAWGRADTGTTGYNLYGVLGSVTNLLGSTTGLDSTNITVTVSPNGSWKFQATAIYGDVGESVPCAALPVFVQAAPAPSVFQPITTRVGSTYNASISWSASPHDYYVTNYVARLTRTGGTGQTTTTASTSAIFTGLISGHYEFTVSGVNMTGEGIPGTRSFNITGGPPGPLKLTQ